MPKVSLRPDIDVRKWGWPGYFTFRKSSPGKSLELTDMEPQRGRKKSQSHGKDEEIDTKERVIDSKAWEEGVPTDKSFSPMTTFPLSKTEMETPSSTVDRPTEGSLVSNPLEAEPSDPPGQVMASEVPPVTGVVFPTTEPIEAVPPEFSTSTVYLADRNDVLATRRRRLFHITVSTIPFTHRPVWLSP
jgi:hypothetical protein